MLNAVDNKWPLMTHIMMIACFSEYCNLACDENAIKKTAHEKRAGEPGKAG